MKQIMIKCLKIFYKKILNSKYYKVLSNNISQGAGFVPQGDYWKEYYFKNTQETLKELEILKKGLDKQSSELVDLIFDRFVYLTPWTKYLNNIYFYTEGLWTDEEIRERKKEVKY